MKPARALLPVYLLLSLVPVYHVGPDDVSHDPEAGHTDLAHEEQYERETERFHARYNTVSTILGPLVVALSESLQSKKDKDHSGLA